jgi:hypothetical protein
VETVRVLVANEPRSYREALAGVLRAICGPFLEVLESEPERLDAVVVGVRPHLVICSLATPAVREAAGVWVELYPGQGSLSNVGFYGELSAVDGMELPDIRSVVERTRAALAGTST